MAYVQVDITLAEIAQPIQTHLYFPNDLPDDVGNKVKGVITLLHGHYGRGADWMNMTAACRYAADNGYVLIAPDAGNSFYADMRYGVPYYTAITELLPAKLQSIFKIPTAREINYIAGLSMGGYGALRIGLSHPERYAAIGSFSGALDIVSMAQAAKTEPSIVPLFAPILGPEFAVPPELDLMELAKQVAKLPPKEQPRILCTCGRQDTGFNQIYPQNQRFRQVAKALRLDYTYAEWDGVHEWNFWDRSLANFIGFIQNSDYGKRQQTDWAAPADISR